MALTIILLLILILLVEQCTVLNLRNAFVLNKKEYIAYPYLKDGVESENYRIKFISDIYTQIYYHPVHQFFMLFNSEGYTKLNAKGRQVFSVDRIDSLQNPFLTPYVFTPNSVYDFTKNKLTEEDFQKVLNEDRDFEKAEWEREMNGYYKLAHVVIYGKEFSGAEGWGFPIYFKVKNHWIKLLTPKDWMRSPNSNGLERRNKQFPAKFEQMALLKDVNLNEHSDNTSSGYRPGYIDTVPYSEIYNTNYKIKRHYYKKEKVCDHYAYTSIPNSYTATAYYSLKTNGEILKFKEHNIKPVFHPVQDYLFWYVLPNKYEKDSQVSFIEYRYPINVNESGSKGLYILHPKK